MEAKDRGQSSVQITQLRQVLHVKIDLYDSTLILRDGCTDSEMKSDSILAA